jgi:pyrroline-5-carboxylate reductase
MPMKIKIAFIGGGNMATAIIAGLLAKGAAASDFLVIEPFDAARQAHAARGIATHALAHADLATCNVWVLATKPQTLQEACDAIRVFLTPDTVVISIAAGIPIKLISPWLGGHQKIIRTMPNTPAKVGLGITGMVATSACTPTDKAVADSVFTAAGQRIWVDSEAMLDPVTAISGSGPGYVFYFMEAMEHAAIELGFDAAQARSLAVQTFRGAAELAAQDSTALATLRERVTSKGGTTYAALSHMQAEKVGPAIEAAIHLANARARELAEQLSKA